MVMVRKLLRDDWDDHTHGNYRIVNNVWNKGALVNGEDYTQSIRFNPADLSRNVVFRWDWPDVGDVIAYPEIIVGYKPWDRDAGTQNLTARIATIETFKVAVDYDISGQRSEFNVAFDLWLTNKPHAGPGTISTELMIWTHDGRLTPAGDKVGIYQHGDFRAEIWVADDFGDSSGTSSATWRYIAVRALTEIRDETIDIGDIIADLVSRDLVDDRDFVNGYEFGAEVLGGKGELHVHNLSHRFWTTADSADSVAFAESAADGFVF
jgi:hypothetical protein